MNFDRMREILIEKAIHGELIDSSKVGIDLHLDANEAKERYFPIPKGWKWVQIKEIATSNVGLTYKPSDISESGEGTPVLRSTNIVDNQFAFESDLKRVVIGDIPEKCLIRNGDLLICSRNGSKRLVGKCAIVSGLKEKCAFGAFMTILRSEHVKYLKYFIESRFFKKTVLDKSNSTSIKQLTQKMLLDAWCPLPPKEDQSRIISRLEELLSEIDRAEKAYQELQTLSGVLRGQILQEAIQGKLVPQLDSEGAVEKIGDAPEDVPFAIPNSWKWRSLEEIFKFIDYRGKTPTKSAEGIRLMTASNIRQGYIDHKRVEFISTEEYASRQSRGISKKGDLLFTTEAPLGNVAIADLETYSAGQRVITLQTDSENKKLLMYFMLSPYFQKALKDNATGTTAQGIKAARLKKMLLPVPPIEEQSRIVAKVDDLLRQVDALSGK